MHGMYTFYLIALIPAVIGFILYLISNKINIIEWAIPSIVGFVIAGIMHICAYQGMVADQEIWSGYVVNAVKYPFWVETYQVAIYKSETYPSLDMDGHFTMKTREVFSHYETRYRDHNQYFTKTAWFGAISQDFRMGESEYNDLITKFGPVETRNGNKSGFYKGDPNIYVCQNKSKVIIPATITKSWSNKVKASPSSFSFQKVPKDAPVYEYPSCLDTWHSDRLLGDAGVKINTMSFDQLNAKLGPVKKVNIIIIGFTNADSKLGKLQEAKFIGGKKNDVVICYGYAPLEGNIPNVCWAYCFSWAKDEQMKRNIEQLFLNEPLDDTILPKIEKEINQRYVKREWSEFDKLTVNPRPIHYYILIGLMAMWQLGAWTYSFFNSLNKND